MARNSALIIVLLSGVLCSCASAYYFPNGAPHRPGRQVDGPPGDVIPEPKDLIPGIPPPPPSNKSEILTMNYEVQFKQVDDDSHKPEPKEVFGINMVPRRKEPVNFRQTRQSGCRQSYSFAQPGQSVVVNSPNYDREYPNNVQTSICFTSPSGTTMKVQCDDFNVEYERSCSYDYVGLGLSGSPSSVQKYCGRGTLSSPQSSSNSLAFTFKSDSSNPGASSRRPYRFSCRVTVSGSSDPATTAAPPPGDSGSGNCTCGQRNDRIVGGSDSKVNEFPWRCYLKTNRYSFFCGCSVISETWILTAAHCTAAVRGEQIFVVVGDHDRSNSIGQTFQVASVHDDPSYNDQTMDHDASLLKLNRAINYNNAISPICLPFNYANDEFQGTTVTASGWGTTSQGGQVSNTLKEVDLPVLTTQQCSRYYPGQITDNMICTYQPGKDTCQGDSGGSIDLNRNGRYYHIGIVSWGIGCAREDNPGVYAKTTKFLSWITSTTGENFCRA